MLAAGPAPISDNPMIATRAMLLLMIVDAPWELAFASHDRAHIGGTLVPSGGDCRTMSAAMVDSADNVAYTMALLIASAMFVDAVDLVIHAHRGDLMQEFAGVPEVSAVHDKQTTMNVSGTSCPVRTLLVQIRGLCTRERGRWFFPRLRHSE